MLKEIQATSQMVLYWSCSALCRVHKPYYREQVTECQMRRKAKWICVGHVVPYKVCRSHFTGSRELNVKRGHRLHFRRIHMGHVAHYVECSYWE